MTTQTVIAPNPGRPVVAYARTSLVSTYGLSPVDATAAVADTELASLVEFARYAAGAQFAAINIIDNQNQVCVAATPGVPAAISNRADSLCARVLYATGAKNTFAVGDASMDSDLYDSPWVCGTHGRIRYYVGAALIGREGLPLGTLCAWSEVPTGSDVAEQAALELAEVRDQLVAVLERRRAALEGESAQTNRFARGNTYRARSTHSPSDEVDSSQDLISDFGIRTRLQSFVAPAHLERQLSEALSRAKAKTTPTALLRADIDGYRIMRERCGDRVAGEVVRAVATRLCAALPMDAIIGQLDNDEFGCVIEECDRERAQTLATQVLRAVATPLTVSGTDVMPTISIGATISELDSTADRLVDEAAEALQRARHRGGDRVEVFDEAMRRRARDNASFADDLHSAIAHHEIGVVYQPIVAGDGKLSGLEALVRWNHPARGQISPAQVIEVAEERGLIHELGRLVLSQACHDAAGWRAALPDLTVSVNMSGRQLVRTNIVTEIDQCLAAAGLDASALCLEVTETVLMEDPGAAAASLKQLRAHGIRVAIDDFGTGYSSLLYLRRFPLNVLKLDRLFVAGVDEDRQDREIVGFVVQLAHALDLRTVAEGVETAAQLKVLQELGCDLIQGYYWSQPVPAAQITEIVERGGVLQGVDFVELTEFPVTGGDIVSAAEPSTMRTSPGRHRVLLVDDSPGQRNLTRVALEDTGRYTVISEADCADDAIQRAREYRPDLVVLDLSMPGRTGLEAIPEILAAAPSAEVAVWSGYVSAGSAAVARSVGAAVCLEKSVSPERLITELDAIL